MIPKVYTYKEAGALLGVSHDTVNRWVKAGRIRAVNVSAGTHKPRFRVREDDLLKFIDDNTHTAPSVDDTARAAS